MQCHRRHSVQAATSGHQKRLRGTAAATQIHLRDRKQECLHLKRGFSQSIDLHFHAMKWRKNSLLNLKLWSFSVPYWGSTCSSVLNPSSLNIQSKTFPVAPIDARPWIPLSGNCKIKSNDSGDTTLRARAHATTTSRWPSTLPTTLHVLKQSVPPRSADFATKKKSVETMNRVNALYIKRGRSAPSRIV